MSVKAIKNSRVLSISMSELFHSAIALPMATGII